MISYEKNILEFNRELNFAGLIKNNFGSLKHGPKPDGLIIVGMGGSGAVGTIFKGLAKKRDFKIPIVVWKSFELPKTNFRHPLYVFISFSGNTQETISGLKKLLAQKNKNNVAVVTTGGAIKDLALKAKLPTVVFPTLNLTPRQASGKMYYSLLTVLLAKKLYSSKQELTPIVRPARFKSKGHQIAKTLRNRIPLIYTDKDHGFLGYLWKTNLNETAKQPAFTNTFPELDHNEIDIFENKEFPLSVIVLKDKKQSPAIQKKIAATKKVLTANRVPYLEINLEGKTEEEKAWNSIVLSHLVSFYLAQSNKINPTQTRLIDQLKRLTK